MCKDCGYFKKFKGPNDVVAPEVDMEKELVSGEVIKVPVTPDKETTLEPQRAKVGMGRKYPCKHKCGFEADYPGQLTKHYKTCPNNPINQNNGTNSDAKTVGVAEESAPEGTPQVQSGVLPSVSPEPVVPAENVPADAGKLEAERRDSEGDGLGNKDTSNDGGDVSREAQPPVQDSDSA